jgi:thioredoxin 1
VSDASGKPLGRSFSVQFWPTLVFLEDGRKPRALVRPSRTDEVLGALKIIDA